MIGIESLEPLARRVRRIDPLIPDGALALLLFGLVLSQAGDARNTGLLNALLAAIETLPLTFRRRAPFAVVLVVGSASLFHLIAGFHNGFFDTFAALVAVYSAAAHSPRRQSLVVLALVPISLTIALLVDWHNRGQVNFADIPYNALLFGSSWVLGDGLRARRIYAEQVAERERLRARATVAEERARIARELHDIVAHSVSVMVLQANAGERIASARPDQAAEHFGVIQATGRQALAELRRLLGILRGGASDGELSPQPQLADLDALADQIRRSGLTTTLSVEGDLTTVPEAVQLSAYRVIQEALTNSLRHAGASSASVSIHRTASLLDVEVQDDGRQPTSAAAPAPGHGLVGMRERIQLFNGTLETGAGPGGGFRVHARFPLNGQSS